MNKLGRSAFAALLCAGPLALAGCADDTTSSSSSVFGSGTTTGTGTTPGGQTVLVRLGTDNLVESVPPLYRKIWVAIVTDTNGNPVAGVPVTFALRSGSPFNPGVYQKGFWFVPAPPAVQAWNQAVTVTCNNEDANFNSILDAGEDLNGNGLLEPPGVSDVTPSGVSDGSGVALAALTYPKNYATWNELTLEARIGAGTPARATFFLVGSAEDYSNVAVAPPGAVSPFGSSGSCADTL